MKRNLGWKRFCKSDVLLANERFVLDMIFLAFVGSAFPAEANFLFVSNDLMFLLGAVKH